jgi:hypothetical protein
MAHRNARLTEFGRLLLVQRITELGWPPVQAAEALGVSRATAYKWLGRYRQHGSAGLTDRSSRPHRCPTPSLAPKSVGSWSHGGVTARAHTAWPGGWGWPVPLSMGCFAAMA